MKTWRRLPLRYTKWPLILVRRADMMAVAKVEDLLRMGPVAIERIDADAPVGFP